MSSKNTLISNKTTFQPTLTRLAFMKNKNYKRSAIVLMSIALLMIGTSKILGQNTNLSDQMSFLETIQIEGKQIHYDTSKKMCLVSLPESFFNKEQVTLTISCSKKTGYHLIFQNKKITEAAKVVLPALCENKQLAITFVGPLQQTSEYTLAFTYLPIVELYGNPNERYTPGELTVDDPESKPVKTRANFKWRGNSSKMYAKKSYAIKLLDDAGNSKDLSFFGLRSDNNWILDAMAIDLGRMRNRVSTDLWNDFSAKPYYYQSEPEMRNGTRGRFVETFLNDQYNGLYCMTEKLDRKQLKLKKYNETIRGLLYKATLWTPEVFMSDCTSKYSNDSPDWEGWEIKYPDLDDDEPIDWAPLYNTIDYISKAKGNDVAKNVGTYFDLPVWTDYFLFIDLLLAGDNTAKNLYVYTYSCNETKHHNRMGVAPWDLDGTWGRAYNSFVMDPYDSFLFYHNLNDKLEQYYPAYSSIRQQRYWDLRNTYWQEEELTQRFEEYFNLFKTSGAEAREIKRWNGYNDFYLDFDSEYTYIKNWVHDRLAVLDEKYHYSADHITDTPNQTNDFSFDIKERSIVIHSKRARTIPLYNLQGQLIQQLSVREGITEVPNLQPGFYLLNKKKIIIK